MSNKLHIENSQLKTENAQLKKRIAELEQQNARLDQVPCTASITYSKFYNLQKQALNVGDRFEQNKLLAIDIENLYKSIYTLTDL